MDTHMVISPDRHSDEPELLVLDSSMRVPTATPEGDMTKYDDFLGNEARAAMERSFGSLQSALDAQPAPGHTIAGTTPVATGASLTIEEMVRQEVRTLVRGWMEDNLPQIVETMVRTEITRMTSRR